MRLTSRRALAAGLWLLACTASALAVGCTPERAASPLALPPTTATSTPSAPSASVPLLLEVTSTPLARPASRATRTPNPVTIEGDRELLRLADPWHALPEGYVPADLVTLPTSTGAPGYGAFELRREAAAGLLQLLETARAAGHDLRVVSAFRSYETQVTIFERRTAAVGEARAARGSAQPGHSEHQLGTTVDLASADVEWRLSQRFGETPAGRWLAEHAHEHGWALSYPAGAEAVTGYTYEPWHARYLGPEHAARWRASGLTVNQYLASLGGPGATPP